MRELEGMARGRDGENKRMGKRESRRDGEHDRVSRPRTRGR